MNRRDLLRNALAGAVASCLKWWPMPAAPIVPTDLRGEPIPDMAEDFTMGRIAWDSDSARTIQIWHHRLGVLVDERFGRYDVDLANGTVRFRRPLDVDVAFRVSTQMPTVKWREATPFEARWGFPEPHGRS